MRLHLRVMSGLQVGDQRRLDPPGGFIGRSESSALHLRDESVSRAHLELRYEHDGWWAYQRSSRSVTLVDGAAAGDQPLALQEQGVLRIGAIFVEYSHARPAEAQGEPVSPATMINVRRQLPNLQSGVLASMTALRSAEPAPVAAPATLILRRPEVAPSADSPPTLIRRPGPPPIPPPSGVSTSAQPAPAEQLAQLAQERDSLRVERDRLAAELQKLQEEHAALRDLQQRDSRPEAQVPSPLPAQALRLLAPFADSLEQASQAFQQDDPAQARALLREASFGLADLRDLFESA